MDFNFSASRANGGQVHSRVSAANHAEARAMLEARGFTDIALTKVDAYSRAETAPSPSREPSALSIPKIMLGCMAIVAIIGVIAFFADQRHQSQQEENEGSLASAQSELEQTSRSGGSITTDPAGRTFGPDRIRNALSREVTISRTINARSRSNPNLERFHPICSVYPQCL